MALPLLGEHEGFTAALLCPTTSAEKPSKSVPWVLHSFTIRNEPSARNPISLLRWLFSRDPFNVVRERALIATFAEEIERLSEAYDVILLFTHVLCPVLKLVSQMALKKIILAPLDCQTMFQERTIRFLHPSFAKALISIDVNKTRKFERSFYILTSPCVFVSSIDAAFVKSLAAGIDARSIPISIDQIYSEITKHAGAPPKIVFTGNMRYRPNVDAVRFIAEEVAPLLKQTMPELSIVIAGRGASRLKIRTALETIRIVSDPLDMNEVISGAMAFICPLRFGSGMKGKVLEAMASGIPVIGSMVALEGIEGVNGVHFERVSANDPLSWAYAIGTLLRDKDRLTRLGNAGRELIRIKHAPHVISESYRLLFEEKVHLTN